MKTDKMSISMGRSFCGIRYANIETESENSSVVLTISFCDMQDKFRFVRIISELIERILSRR